MSATTTTTTKNLPPSASAWSTDTEDRPLLSRLRTRARRARGKLSRAWGRLRGRDPKASMRQGARRSRGADGVYLNTPGRPITAGTTKVASDDDDDDDEDYSGFAAARLSLLSEVKLARVLAEAQV